MSTTVAPTRAHVTVPVILDPETRTAGGELKLSGLAAPYERESLDIGFYEVIERGAFGSLEDNDVLLLWQHRDDQPLARVSAGNLMLEDARDGIRFTAKLPATTLARDAVELVRSGVVTEMSFGFVVESDRWETRGDKRVRVVKAADLFELSLVTEAAYGKATSVANRSSLQRQIESTVARMRKTPTTVDPYEPGSEHSYFRDLYEVALRKAGEDAMVEARIAGLPVLGPIESSDRFPSRVHGGLEEAEARLKKLDKHLRETRDLTTTATDGGGFALANAPVFVSDLFANAVRANAALPFILPREPLPEYGMSVSTARITTGLSTALQSSENAAVNEVDLVEAEVASPVSTFSGQVDMSQQLFDQAAPGFDAMVASELGKSLAGNVDTLLLTGTGTAPQLRGLDNVSGITTVAYTDGTPTQAEFWPKLVEAAARLATALGKPPTHVLAHPRRIAWLSAWIDSAGNAVAPELPFGMRLVPVSSITTTSGAGTNEDRAYVIAADELPIMLGDVRVMIFPQVLSATLTVRTRAHQFASALFGRRPEAIAVVAGTGLTAPYA